MSTVTSPGNPLFKALMNAKKDKALMLLEGRRLVMDAIKRGLVPEMTAMTPEYREAHGPLALPAIVLSGNLFARIAETRTPQGILAFFPAPWAGLEKAIRHEKILILDGLQDPGNVGTIIRTAEAFGFSGILIAEGTASPFSPKTIRASMGSSLGVDIAAVCRDDLKQLPHRIISLAPRGSVRLSPGVFKGKIAICLGQEGAGLSREIIELSHASVSIPMKGDVESLNVSIAAGIVMACAAGVLSRR